MRRMPDSHLRDIIENLRSRLQTNLEAEFATLADSHDEALERARREAEALAEQQWASRLEAVHADWDARLQSEITAARAEVERRLTDETSRARAEAEQAAAQSAAALRQELDQTLAGERARAQEALGSERARTQQELTAERARAQEERAERGRAEHALAEAQAELEGERQRTAGALDAARRTTPPLDTARLVSALRTIDDASSLTGVLRAVVNAAAAEARRATLFILNGSQLDEWTVPGGSSMSAGSMQADGREAGFLATVLSQGEPIASGAGQPAPTFAALGADRHAFAVPLVLGGQVAAVLYADDGLSGESKGGWVDAVQILGRHAAAALACLTAQKTVAAIRLAGGQPAAQAAGPTPAEEGEQGARRYARLLVSEVKLYNEAAVRLGRQMRDLSQRLRPEIDRARRLYLERISPALVSRDLYFQQELVQTLADGDPSLLG